MNTTETIKLMLDALCRHTSVFVGHDDVAVDRAIQAGKNWLERGREPVALDVTIEGDSAKLLAAMLEPVLDEEPIPIRLLVGNGHSGHGLYVAAAEYQDEGAALLVNTSPPASKPWVGLTRDERMSIINRLIGQDWVYALDAIEAKLKEKNA